MNGPTLRRRALKLRARKTLIQFALPCMAASAFLLLFTLLAQYFSTVTGGVPYYLMLDVQQFPMETGVWKADPVLMSTFMDMVSGRAILGSLGGIVFSLRDNANDMVLVLPLAWRQLMNLIVIQAIVFLITVPLQYGVLEQFHNILAEHPLPFRRIFHWYVDLRLTGKALVVQIAVTLWGWTARILCMVPGLLCLFLSSRVSGYGFLILLYSVLSMLGLFLGYYLYTLLLPAHYLLAQSPHLSIRQAFSQGAQMVRGRRKEYFTLNLSFFPWQIASIFLMNLPALYLQPYIALSNYLFLNAPTQEAPQLDVI